MRAAHCGGGAAVGLSGAAAMEGTKFRRIVRTGRSIPRRSVLLRLRRAVDHAVDPLLCDLSRKRICGKCNFPFRICLQDPTRNSRRNSHLDQERCTVLNLSTGTRTKNLAT